MDAVSSPNTIHAAPWVARIHSSRTWTLSRRAATASLDARTVRVTAGSRLPGPFQKVGWAAADAAEAAREAAARARDLTAARLHYFEGMRALFTALYRAVRGEGPPPEPVRQALPVAELLDRVFEQSRATEERAA
jgi:hypothetical protein